MAQAGSLGLVLFLLALALAHRTLKPLPVPQPSVGSSRALVNRSLTEESYLPLCTRGTTRERPRLRWLRKRPRLKVSHEPRHCALGGTGWSVWPSGWHWSPVCTGPAQAAIGAASDRVWSGG